LLDFLADMMRTPIVAVGDDCGEVGVLAHTANHHPSLLGQRRDVNLQESGVVPDGLRLLERDPVLTAIRCVLRLVPFELVVLFYK
jgi:hypothetical protein